MAVLLLPNATTATNGTALPCGYSHSNAYLNTFLMIGFGLLSFPLGIWVGFCLGVQTGVQIGRFGKAFLDKPGADWDAIRYKQVIALARYYIEQKNTTEGQDALRKDILEKIAATQTDYDARLDLEEAGLDVREIERKNFSFFRKLPAYLWPWGRKDVGMSKEQPFPDFIYPPRAKRGIFGNTVGVCAGW